MNVIYDLFGMTAVPRKLFPFASGCNSTDESATVVPFKFPSAGISMVFLKKTGYFLLIPATRSCVVPSTDTRIVSLTMK